MRGTYLLLIILCIPLFYSCGENADTSNTDGDYRLFNLEQAGWKSKSASQHVKGITYTATQVPIQYYIMKELGGQNIQKIDSIFSTHKSERIIEVEFQHATNADLLKSEYTRMDYESAVKYMSFKIEEDFIAVTAKGDSIDCSGVTFERNFKVAPFKRILLHFGNIPAEDQIQLVYMDRLFGNGILKFKFQETPLKL